MTSRNNELLHKLFYEFPELEIVRRTTIADVQLSTFAIKLQSLKY